MNLLRRAAIPLGPLFLVGVQWYCGNSATRVMLPLWWLAVALLFRDRQEALGKSLWGAVHKTSLTWLPLGLAWVFYFVPATAGFFPLDKALLGSLCIFASACWQARLWEGENTWVPRPFWVVLAVALLWLPFHILKPAVALKEYGGTIDPAVFHCMAYNYVEGNGLWVSFFHFAQDYLGCHFAPILYLFFLPYHLIPSPTYLITLQAFGIAAGGLMLYGFARHRTGDRTFSAVLALAFFLHPMVQGVQQAWFHMVAFAPAILFGLLWVWSHFYDPRREETARGPKWKGVVAFLGVLLLALCLKEDVGVVLFFLGAALVVSRPRHWTGWATLGIALVWVATAMLWIIPAHREFGGYAFFDRLFPAGEGESSAISVSAIVDVLANRIGRLEKLKYVAYMGIPFAFLWIRGRQWLLPGVPVFGWVVLSNNWIEYAFYPCQYPALPLTALFIASVGAAARLKGTLTLRRWTWAILVSSVFFHLLVANGRIDQWVNPKVLSHAAEVDPRATELTETLNSLPPEATIWSDACHLIPVENPLNYLLIPWDELPADYPHHPDPLYLVVKADGGGTPQWCRDLLSEETRSPHWRLLLDNPYGSVFEWLGIQESSEEGSDG